ncbi:Recombinase [Pirellula staleyi DSM 6068]|uniref:Recombinase n=1 Tax=Pirellula staleyi (strain ATCC 27377 / DSM 6068 / ICPB 4128) TaxID=530564 RepID=D2R2T0_PIRSD|nr:recombinase family protein [Pirellula staleyi]ADB16920.1 Recombinase [Pirellula staleyi DSM 6068]
MANANGIKRLSNSRFDVVFIRKSTQSQDVTGQIANVENMLAEKSLVIPKERWFVCTVTRAKVRSNPDFQKLMELISEGRVGTVYIESQDRWGTGHLRELYILLELLSEHGTGLYDLRGKLDLTEEDDLTEMQTFLGGIRSKKERKDISYRSLRTRLNNFRETGTWPTGTHPFGYGKRCYSPSGKILWEWQPVSRSRGQVFYPSKSGKKLIAGQENVRIPSKGKLDKSASSRDRTVLVPSNNKEFVKTVRLVFELFTRVGLSRRKIAQYLNRENRKFYNKEFTYSFVTQILGNPAYVGDTHFGKSQTGELNTFNSDGLIVPLKRRAESSRRAVSERIIKKDTHAGLIDRKTWDLAQKKLESGENRSSFSPRNPNYYLKQIFVCGHCGSNMTGRTDPKTKKVLYVCSSYVNSRVNGTEMKCGFNTIAHDYAEQLLLNKLKEMGVGSKVSEGTMIRGGLDERLAQLGHADEESSKLWSQYFSEGLKAFAVYITESFPDLDDYKEIQRLKKLAASFYFKEDVDCFSFARLPIKNIRQLREAIIAAEGTIVGKAMEKLSKLKREHEYCTEKWLRMTELQEPIIRRKIDRLESQIEEWEPRTVSLSKRLKILCEAETERQAERDKLIDEWPRLQARERGEALRQIFNTVKLFWNREFHAAREIPDRPRKTDRPGRFKYTLDCARIEWGFATTDLNGSS